MSDVITRISQTQCCDPVIDSLLGEAKQQIAALTAELQQAREERDLTVGHHIAAGQLMDRAIAERDAALKVRDLAREASNRDLQAKRDAESERNRLAAELARSHDWRAEEFDRVSRLAEQRLKALKAVEWNEAGMNGPKLTKAGWADVRRCPWCHFYKPSHSPDCIVGLAIGGGE